MRYTRLVYLILGFLVTFNSNAADLSLESHAMIYYTVPLGGSPANSKPSFGLRFDEAYMERGKGIDYNRLFDRPAVFDLKMDRDGLRSIELAGTDFLPRLRALQQNGESDTDVDATAGTDSETTEEAGAEAEADSGFELPSLRDVFGDQLPGLLLGVGFGVALLIGVGSADN